MKGKEIYIELDDNAKNFLVEKGFQPELGARPLKRTIETYLEDPLAEKILLNPNEGRRCLVTLEDNHLTFIDKEIIPLKKSDDKKKKARKKKKVEKKQEQLDTILEKEEPVKSE